ncbi:hypothetical protein WISP_61957 [Willisornis vidua]|uniref:Uncharacterized protein n=1 Tax=Willisornis vidua TaxID=1566151 RepID=A0ABQ9DG99_9PASS|nr:hypothetical protein WISP_61957 [Willisornis vidua]
MSTDKKASDILVCISHSVASMARTVDQPSVLVTGEATPRVLCSVLALHDKKDIEVLEHVQRRATELGNCLEHKSDEEQLRKVEAFSLEKRRLRGDLTSLYNCLKGGCSQQGLSLFSHITRNRPRGNRPKLHQRRFRLDIKENFFTERLVRH